jgi:recombination protein RecA
MAQNKVKLKKGTAEMASTTSNAADREKALTAALTQIERSFGKGAIMRLGDSATIEVDTISTGSLGLDHALGVGGIPRGRVIEVFGPEARARPR